jgi:molecular chaperone GrpE
MTEKRHPKHKGEAADSEREATQTPDGLEESESVDAVGQQTDAQEIQALRQKLAETEASSAGNLDGWQRALAEFQNYKKRVERDREADQAAMKGDLIKKVLPVLDDLERALHNRPEKDAWTDGIELIQRKLASILEGEGVKRIEAEGAIFDPNFHEAISQEPVDGAESGRVIAIVQNGYMLGERVLRPALVRVAK